MKVEKTNNSRIHMSGTATGKCLLPPKSAFGFFVQSRYIEYKQKNNNSAVPKDEFARDCANAWKDMSPDERKPFDELAANEDGRLNCQASSCDSNHESPSKDAKTVLDVIDAAGSNVFTVKQDGVLVSERSRLTIRPSSVKSKRRIRAQVSPYGYFVKSEYEKRKALDPTSSVAIPELSKEFAARWREMTDNDKQQYYDLAAEDQERLDDEVANFNASKDSPSP